MASGRIVTRTSTVRGMMPQPQGRPMAEWSHSRSRVRTSSIGPRIDAVITRPASGRAAGRGHSRPRRDSTGCSEAGASRRGAFRAGPRTRAARRSRTASRRGGTCSEARAAGSRATGRPGRGRRGVLSRRAPAEDLLHALPKPREPARLDELGQPRPRDEHVVVLGGELVAELVEGGAQAALHAVALGRAAELARDGEPQARALGRLFAREGVEDEVAGRNRAALSVDGIEVAGAGEGG